MQIRFTKMQGAGNDFVVLDETQGRLGLTAAHYRNTQLAARITCFLVFLQERLG